MESDHWVILIIVGMILVIVGGTFSLHSFIKEIEREQNQEKEVDK